MSRRRRRDRVPGTSHRALFVLPAIRDSYPDELKSALAVRAVCATEGICPSCGATGDVHPDAIVEGFFHYVFEHAAGCPALTDEVAA